ncbi:MAG: hypothetical protein JKY02_08860, partial [Flavobacteriaceae bacterium]|nr:hypothetical protein [Flavobacteriaceae bacterium]
SEFFEDSIHEGNKVQLSTYERGILRTSWISGIFVAITSIIGMIVEYILIHDGDFYNNGLFYRLGWSIPFLTSLFFFLRGYKKLGDVFENKTLVSATYIYFGIEVVITLTTLALSVFYIEEYTSGILSGIVIVLLFGVGELILGISVLKLKEYLGPLAQVVGILKIVNGAMFISIIFSPISVFLMIPILIMEIVLMYNATQKIGK